MAYPNPEIAQLNKIPHRILLVGNPNSGKTTLFNRLTGLNYKTANYPGVTVETKSGFLKTFDPSSQKMVEVECVDLPGVYSLFPESEDESVACREILKFTREDLSNTVVLFVADSTNLDRSLFLLSQIKDLGVRLVLVLNQADLAEKIGQRTDLALLEKFLGGIPCFEINSRGNKSVNELKRELRETQIPIGNANTDFLNLLNEPTHSTSHRLADAIKRHQEIGEIISRVVKKNEAQNTLRKLSSGLDSVLIHHIWGLLIFLGTLFVIFQTLFSWSELPMNWIEQSFSFFIEFARHQIPDGVVQDLICSGILPGLSGIFVFIPQISFLFLFISLMEESGYMARATYLFDGFMRRFGLNGRSIIPLIGGAACAVPSILATRTISNRKERFITIFVTPLISCSARLPVYTIMIALVIPDKNWGPIHYQGLVLFGLYLLGVIVALGTAFILKLFLPSTEKSFLMMEMPVYKKPHVRNVLAYIWGKIRVFVTEAGSIILLISIILWVLSSYSFPGRMEKAELEVVSQNDSSIINIQNKISAAKLEASFAGIMGKKIEPVIAPLGFDWKIGIALITSFAAREVFVGTMSTLYSVGNSGDMSTLTDKLKNEKNANTGEPIFTLRVGLSLLIFYVFALQCMSTLAVVKRETGNWKIPLLQFLYMGLLAYLGSYAAYHLF